MKHSHFVCGSLEQGVGQGELGEAVASTSKVCKYFYQVLINTCVWPVSFMIVYAYMNLSLMDRSSFRLIVVE
jgi:hypothetical protein